MHKHQKVLKTFRKQLSKYPNVVATGLGLKSKDGNITGEVSIICSVSQKIPKDQLKETDLIPASVGGIKTDVVQTGKFKALGATDRMRPAPGGVSIGHKNITAGTLGCTVKKDGNIMILSNNHVLANSNAGKTGDSVLQPGPYDGGTDPDDKIGTLYEFTPIVWDGDTGGGDDGGGDGNGGDGGNGGGGCAIASAIAKTLNLCARVVGSKTRLQPVSIRLATNVADCAIAKPTSADMVIEKEILNIGKIDTIDSAYLGMPVKKSGRTTGLKEGIIIQTDVTVQVEYGEGKTATFNDQLIATYMCEGGDSGSAVLSTDNDLVGLLFAGSDTSTVINRIENVFAALNITL